MTTPSRDDRPGDDELPPDPFGPSDPPMDPAADLPFTDGGAGGSATRAADFDPPVIDPATLDPDALGQMFGPMMGDLVRMIGAMSQGRGGGPLNWDTARQMALFAATEGRPEDNADPAARIQLEELCRIAELHVSEATGLEVSGGGRGVVVVANTRSAHATQLLDDFTPLLELIARALATPPMTAGTLPPELGDMAALAGLFTSMGPMLAGMQAGSMAGHLATTLLGTYDLPIPRPGGDRVGFVPRNIDAFAAEWSLAKDAVRMRICLGELAHHAVLRRAHVSARLMGLLHEHAKGFKVNPEAIEARFGELDPSDPASMQAALSDPAALLGAVRSAEQEATSAKLRELLGLITSYSDHIVRRVAGRVLGDDAPITEALKRRRITASDAHTLAEQLLGVRLDRASLERGAAFIRGVVDRAGDDALTRLWLDETHLPTPAEIAAPGLWLARIDL